MSETPQPPPEEVSNARLLEDTARKVARAFGITPPPPIKTPPQPEEDSTSQDRGKPRIATPEERDAELQHQRSELEKKYNDLVKRHQLLHPPPYDDGQPPQISLTELCTDEERKFQELDDKMQARIQERVDGSHWELASRFYHSELPYEEAQTYLRTFSENDRTGVETYLSDCLYNNPESRTIWTMDGEVRIDKDPNWLKEWRSRYPQSPAETSRRGLNLKERLSGIRIFGQPLTDFLIGMGAGAVTRTVAR